MTAPVTWGGTAEEALERLEGRLFATTTEAAAILRCDPRTLLRDIRDPDGGVPAVRVGVTYRVRVAWLREQAGLNSPATSAKAS